MMRSPFPASFPASFLASFLASFPASSYTSEESNMNETETVEFKERLNDKFEKEIVGFQNSEH